MTAADRMNFAHAYGVMAEMFNEPVSTTKMEGYFAALSDLPYDDVSRAIRVVMQEARFFPRPVELREAVRGNPDQRAEQRWGLVLEAVRRVGYVGHPQFEDPLVLQAIERLWGSWNEMCRTLPSGGPELVGWIKQFRMVYATLATRHQQDLKQPMLPAATREVFHRLEDIAKRKALPAGETIQTDLNGVPMWAGAHLVGDECGEW